MKFAVKMTIISALLGGTQKVLGIDLKNLNLDTTSIYLHTVDIGDPIYSKFGHTAVRVEDTSKGYDQVFNLGVFDDADPMFAVNFYTGVMYYLMVDYPFQRAMQAYRYEKRPAWQDKILLTKEEKSRFLEKLAWQALPENRAYPYQYFFDNCSTRIRDFFDYALSGQLKSSVGEGLSQDTFRDTVRQGMATFSFGAMSLDILMNSRLDRPMTQWEEMYLPLRLRSHLMALKLPSGESRVAETSVLVKGTVPTPPDFTAYMWAVVIMGLPVLVYLVSKLVLKQQQFQLQSARTAILFWGVWSSIYGIVMTANWMLSSHLDLHHNACLWIFSPLDLVLVYMGIKFKSVLDSKKLSKPILWFAVLRMSMMFGVFLAQKTGVVAQDVTPIYLSFGIVGMLTFVILGDVKRA